MASIRVYRCPGSAYVSRFPDLRDCPTIPIDVELGGGSSGSRTRFLGARGRYMDERDYLAQFPAPSLEPAPPEPKRFLWIGLAGFLFVFLLLFATRRRKR